MTEHSIGDDHFPGSCSDHTRCAHCNYPRHRYYLKDRVAPHGFKLFGRSLATSAESATAVMTTVSGIASQISVLPGGTLTARLGGRSVLALSFCVGAASLTAYAFTTDFAIVLVRRSPKVTVDQLERLTAWPCLQPKLTVLLLFAIAGSGASGAQRSRRWVASWGDRCRQRSDFARRGKQRTRHEHTRDWSRIRPNGLAGWRRVCY
jgi:hypothetical protein